MKKILLIIWIISFGFISSIAHQLSELDRSKELGKNDELINSRANSKPNIVFLLVDELAWSDVGYNCNALYGSPNVDQFAKEDVGFDHDYAASPVCPPSLTSILIGKNPGSIDLTDFLPGRREFFFQQLNNADINSHLPFEEIALAEDLKEHGYRTGMHDKWHLGEDSSGPLEHGFDVHVPTDWDLDWTKTGFFYPFKMDGLEGVEGDYHTIVLTDEALKFIKKNKYSAFFLYSSLFAVHDPIEVPQDLVEKYEQRLIEQESQDRLPYILDGNPDAHNPRSGEEFNAFLYEEEYRG